MTIDQRLEFLLQSTESLHATTQSLHATTTLHSEQLGKVIHDMRLTEHKFRELTATMSELALTPIDHERRLGKLDGAQDES